MRSLVLALSPILLSCSSNLELPSSGGGGAPTVSLEPIGSFEAAPSVLRIRVENAAARSALVDFRFFSGELGAYHLGRIRARELPATLLERELPVLAWSDGADVVVAPVVRLESGKYTLATPELGVVAEVVVQADMLPVLERAWPPSEHAFGVGTAVFCGDVASVDAEPVTLAPAGAPGSIARGLDESGAFSEQCVRVEPDERLAAGVPLLPPALAGGALLEPRVLVVAREAPAETVCDVSELPLGPTCAAVADDRVELRSYGAAAFVALETPRALFGAVGPGRSLVVRGFTPSSTARITGLAFDVLGERVVFDATIVTAPPRPHVVLNEVLANPAGAEAASEWLELANDGSEPVELAGFVLDDAVEPVALPPHTLMPGELALLVAESYAPDPELDLLPPPEMALLRVPRLGRSGLANSGELLRLRDPNGVVVSRFPAIAAPGPGRSVARRSPDAPDEASSFGAHAPPGASPGLPNEIDGD